MRKELELELQEKFPFMRQNKIKGEHNIYIKWGIECSSGWYQLIHDLCLEITNRYAVDEVSVDIVVQQIKEKFASNIIINNTVNLKILIRYLQFNMLFKHIKPTFFLEEPKHSNCNPEHYSNN